MQIQTTKRVVETDIDTPIKNFSIKNSPMAFKILSDKLYSDKPLAVVRELGCNAYDAHVAAGTMDTPFEVHLPNQFEPWFHIRDYGTGMSEEQVMNLYTTYFESTKSDSNDFVGALGLGSKSPFSYVDQFLVIGYHGGMKKTYTAFIDQAGTPAITKNDEEPSDEPNGIHIQMPVEVGDFSAFAKAAKKVFHRFPTLPKVTGNREADLTQVKYVLEGPNYKLRSNEEYSYGSHSRCYAVQGTVAYPIDPYKINIPMNEKQREMLNNMPVDIIFPIGELDIAPSREELSYDKRTQANIMKAVDSVIAHVPDFARSILDAADSIYAAKLLYGKWLGDNSQQSRFMRTVLDRKLVWKGQEISDAIIKVRTYNFAAVDASKKAALASLVDSNNSQLQAEVLTKNNVQQYGDTAYFSARSLDSKNRNKRLSASYQVELKINLANEPIIILTDDNRMGRQVVRWIDHNYTDCGRDVVVLRVPPQFHKEVVSQLEGCPNIILSSTLNEPPVIPADPTAKKKDIRKLYRVKNFTNSTYDGGVNLSSEEEVDVNDGGYYLCRYNKEIIHPGHEFPDDSNTAPTRGGQELAQMLYQANQLGMMNDNNGQMLPIFVFNSTHKHLVKKNPKWINLYDHLKTKTAEMLADKAIVAQLDAITVHHTIDQYLHGYNNIREAFPLLKSGIKPVKAKSKWNSFIETMQTHFDLVDTFYKTATGNSESTVVGSKATEYKPSFLLFSSRAEKFLALKPYDKKKAEAFCTKIKNDLAKSYPYISVMLSDMCFQTGSYAYRSNDRNNWSLNKKYLTHYINVCDASPSLTHSALNIVLP